MYTENTSIGELLELPPGHGTSGKSRTTDG